MQCLIGHDHEPRRSYWFSCFRVFVADPSALAPRLVHDQRRRHRGVQRLDRRLHRNRDALVGARRRAAAASPGPRRRSASRPARSGRRRTATVRRAARWRRCGSRWRRASATAASAVMPATIGSRSALPIDPRSAFQPNGSADAPAATTPVAPAASATRTIAPRLPGSCTSTATTTSGAAPAKTSLEPVRRALAPARRCALDDRTGLIASITDARDA